MIPYELDPSLHTGEPASQLLDDGFSPPHPQPAPEVKTPADTPPPLRPAESPGWAKSAF